MDLELNGRTAVVCGGSEGIGLGIAEALATRARTSSSSRAGRTSSSARPSAWARSRSRATSASRPTSRRLVETAVDAHGGVDIVVNNSGGPPRTTALEMNEENVRKAVELLLVSAVRLTSLSLPYLEQSKAGRIVNVTSSTVREPVDNLALSNAVRPGVVGWAKTLARELGPKGITVNSIAPGRIDTGACPRGVPRRADRGRPRRPSRLGRLGTAREIGDLVAFLCSDRAAYISGTVIPVDGGLLRSL